MGLLDELIRSPELPITRRDRPVCIGLSAGFEDSTGLTLFSGSPTHHCEVTPEDGIAVMRPSMSPKACGTTVVSVKGSLLEVGKARDSAFFPDHSPTLLAVPG